MDFQKRTLYHEDNLAFDIVKRRMEDNRQLLGDSREIHYSTTPPLRTDTRQEASPRLFSSYRFLNLQGQAQHTHAFGIVKAQQAKRMVGEGGILMTSGLRKNGR